MITNYYSLRSWRDQSLKVIFGVAASSFCPFSQFYSVITAGAFIIVMSTKLHLLHRHKNVLYQSGKRNPFMKWLSWGCSFKEHLSLGGNFILNFCSTHFLLRLIDMRSYPICKRMTCDCIMMTYTFCRK